jgi:hypothetical protein
MSRAPVRRTRRRSHPTYAERALLAIAHRFTTIRGADQVVVLDHGQVAAMREHEVRWTPTMTALASPSRQDEGPSCHGHTSSTRHRCSSDLTQIPGSQPTMLRPHSARGRRTAPNRLRPSDRATTATPRTVDTPSTPDLQDGRGHETAHSSYSRLANVRRQHGGASLRRLSARTSGSADVSE